MVISRCCFAEDGKEMYQNVNRTCKSLFLLIKPIVLRRCRCRCRHRCLSSLLMSPQTVLFRTVTLTRMIIICLLITRVVGSNQFTILKIIRCYNLSSECIFLSRHFLCGLYFCQPGEEKMNSLFFNKIPLVRRHKATKSC